MSDYLSLISDYLPLIISMAIDRSFDIAQSLIAFAVLVVGALAWVGLPRRAVEQMTARVAAGKYMVVILLAVVATRLFLAPYWVWQDEMKKLEAVIEERDTTLQALNAKGDRLELVTEERDQARQELIAKRDRRALKEKLKQFYADSRRLAEGGGLTAKSSEKDVQKYSEQTGEWGDDVSAWLQENMWTGAAEYFRDTSSYLKERYVVYSNTANKEHLWRMNLVNYWRRNLVKLIESDDWDQPNGTR